MVIGWSQLINAQSHGEVVSTSIETTLHNTAYIMYIINYNYRDKHKKNSLSIVQYPYSNPNHYAQRWFLTSIEPTLHN